MAEYATVDQVIVFAKAILATTGFVAGSVFLYFLLNPTGGVTKR